jgi:hypothetical protein
MARPAVRVWAVSCHKLADIERAAALGADVAVLFDAAIVLKDGVPQLPSGLAITVYAPRRAATEPAAFGPLGDTPGMVAQRISDIFP